MYLCYHGIKKIYGTNSNKTTESPGTFFFMIQYSLFNICFFSTQSWQSQDLIFNIGGKG